MDKNNGKMIVNDYGICQRIYVDDKHFTDKIVIPKEAFIEAYNRFIKEAENNETYDDIIATIDNAPTVSDRYDEGYAQGYIDGQTGADYDERVRE